MDVKDFERYLELMKLEKEFYSDPNNYSTEDYFKLGSELRSLKKKMVEFIFGNQSSVETVIDKLKIRLNHFSEYPNSDENKTFNEIKIVKEILYLLDTYDWKFMYSTYNTEEGKQIAIWEQSSDGKIRNHKVWNISEAINNIANSTKEAGNKIGDGLKSISESIN